MALVAGGAAGGLMLVEACSEPVGHMLVDAGTAMMDAAGERDSTVSNEPDGGGELLVDAGSLLADAGELLREAGMALVDAGTNVRDSSSDAAAQPAASAYRSGSRIQMHVAIQNGADGSVYAGYPVPFDVQRNEGCFILRAADGKLRCLPTSAGTYATLATFFANAGCTQPIYQIAETVCPTSTYFLVQDSVPSSCGTITGVRVYQRGPKHMGNYFVKSGANCTAAPQVAGVAWYAVGAEVPAASFVEFVDAAPVTL